MQILESHVLVILLSLELLREKRGVLEIAIKAGGVARVHRRVLVGGQS
jgi:hypothetical protein